MLELKNVSKFYYSKGMVSSGFSKVSLKFELGEFVAITGESGSGKSTLLNVISGLDSYEEGEMYINGEETSHYTEKDYEEYRRKYIGNIFQNFNLVNSYTVYQNVELILLLNGFKKKEVKNKIYEILKSVDLYKYRNKKVSKLSGGQKQRVAIARALASDAPIILADEPTGNLDKKSSESVLKLLHELSRDKLVIIVTHNYDQIEKYVTRKITMHDGRVLEDKKIKDYEKVSVIKENNYSDIKWYNKIRLGFRNSFNILSKFLLITFVYLFMSFSIFFAYSSYAQSDYNEDLTGNNMYFQNISDKRIVIKKYDKTAFNDEDYEKISNLDNIDLVVKNDLSLDEGISMESDNYFLYGTIHNIKEINKVDVGRMPNNNDEIVVVINENDYFKDSYLDKIFNIFDLQDVYNNKKYNVKVVGIIYSEDYQNSFYVNDKVIEDLTYKFNQNNTTIKYTFYDTKNESYVGNIKYEIIPSNKVKEGNIVISDEWSYLCKNMKCKGKSVSVQVSNIYYKFNKSFIVSEVYNKKNFNKLTGYKFDKYDGALFINNEDYNNLYDNNNYQSSVFIKDTKLVKETINELENLGVKTLYIKDVIFPISEEFVKVFKIVLLVLIIGLLVALFFISYFIIKLILKSRNIYYSTLRILGSTLKTTKDLLKIELIVLSHVAFIIFSIFILLVKNSIIKSSDILELTSFVGIKEYALMYLTLLIMTLLIASRYSRKLFKGTVMNTYKEEV